MILTHGHFDHFEDAVALGRALKPKVVANFEICQYLEMEGVTGTCPMNKGGTQEVEGIRVTMVAASHTSSIRAGDRILPGGEAAGYILEFENGFKVYDAGDTSVFGDMKLIADLYRPDLTLLPIGDLFTMGPREAALACRLMRPRRVIPDALRHLSAPHRDSRRPEGPDPGPAGDGNHRPEAGRDLGLRKDRKRRRKLTVTARKISIGPPFHVRSGGGDTRPRSGRAASRGRRRGPGRSSRRNGRPRTFPRPTTGPEATC